MDARPNSSTQVLIVGAGPTGLMLACGLAQCGVDFRIIDKKDGLSTFVKASEVTARSLEDFEDFGIVEQALELGVAVRRFNVYAHGKVAWQSQYGEIDSPYQFQLHLGQPYTEQLLFGYLQSRGHDVEWGGELVSYQDGREAVSAVLRHPDGQEETVSATYLAACDGASSTVREQQNEKLTGHTYPADNLIANVKLDWAGTPGEVYAFLSEDGELTVNVLPDGYHQLGGPFPLKKGEQSRKGQNGTLEELQAMFDRRSAIPGRITEAVRIVYFWSHDRAVDRQVRGRVFLLGDAAHMVSPNTGLGMNTGLQDAHNLGWKLHLVLAGVADESLLQSFQDERNRVLKGLGKFSDRIEFMYGLRNPIAKGLRNELMPFLMSWGPMWDRQNNNMAQTDVAYRKSPIVAQDLGFPAHWPGGSHLSEHGSCPSTWFQFGEGPQAGDRACDARPVTRPDGAKDRLFDYLGHGKHTLLLFLACTDPQPELRRTLEQIASQTRERYGDWIETYLVVPGAEPPKDFDWKGQILFDTENVAHNRYGAAGECLYLIRPDKFVGYRSLPPDWDKLAKYLESRVFKRVKAPAMARA
ncbi:MAG: FAD-dependent monooxygenase [Dehalococcoidia bacterium]